MDIKQLLVNLIAIVIALTVHEYAHAFVSYILGDKTVKQDGRLSLNPVNHLDPIGTLFIVFAGMGWAKPVQVNTLYYKDRKKGLIYTALAGPASNILLAFVSMFILKLLAHLLGVGVVYGSMGLVGALLNSIIGISISLAVFNMIPIPPLDGFKVFQHILPRGYVNTMMQYQQYAALILVLAIRVVPFVDKAYFMLISTVYNLLDILTII